MNNTESFINLQDVLKRRIGSLDFDEQIVQLVERSSENTSIEQKTANYDFLKLSYSAKESASRVSASKGNLESSEGDPLIKTDSDYEKMQKRLEILSPAHLKQNSSGVLTN